ncbi:MAG: PAS domain-containing protein [Chitinophagaceae bacterium]|nr:PAS domain-containing protein [Chitinophagaceae bacterium]
MSNHLSLVRKAQTIITYLNDHLFQGSRNDITQVFSMMQTLQNVFPQWVLMSCPAQHPGVFFITDNCKHILGYGAEELSVYSHSDFLLSRIHEDDLEDMHRCFSFIESFLKETMPYEYMSLRFMLQYRFRHSEGHFISIHHEKAILPLDNSEPLYYSVIKDVTHELVFTGVKLEIYKHNSVLTKITEYYPGSDHVRLSKREQEIVELMQTGLSTKQIAHRLQISQHTARNIKQKMFEKYKVNNSIALLNKTVYQQ